MNFHSVQVALSCHNGDYPSSGIMLNNGHVLTTITTLAPVLTESDFQKIANRQSNQIIEFEFKYKLKKKPFLIYFKDDEYGPNRGKRAFLVNYFFSEAVWESTKNIFSDWSIDYEGNKENFNLMSLFFILKIEHSEINLQNDVNLWFKNLPKTAFKKGQKLRCISAAFGSINFLDHWSVGIVSNINGRNNSLIFSDLPLTPGSEGSPVYCDSICPFPMGIVISAINWWRNEWINFNVIADLRQVLQEIVSESNAIDCGPYITNSSSLLNAVESSLFQVYNGFTWGTAILIEKEKGILLTNKHVIDHNVAIIIHTKEGPVLCELIYGSPDNFSLDIAILKTRKPLGPSYKSINFSKKKLLLGELVYAAGFPLFRKESKMGATITQGYISHVHPHIIKTTCNVYPGASGGAILDQDGDLIAVIVCNARITKPLKSTFSNFNMNIPISILQPVLENYIHNCDVKHLKNISQIDARAWNVICKY